MELQAADFLHPKVPPVSSCPWSNTIAYRNMCRFQAKTLFELPIMRNLEYYMRLDAHSYIQAPVKMDIFTYMKSNNLLYGYPCVWRDDPRCTENLWSATEFYMMTKKITPHFYEKMKSSKMFFTFWIIIGN